MSDLAKLFDAFADRIADRVGDRVVAKIEARLAATAQSPWVRLADVAEVDRTTIKRAIDRGEIRASKPGRHIVVHRDDVARLIESKRIDGTIVANDAGEDDVDEFDLALRAAR